MLNTMQHTGHPQQRRRARLVAPSRSDLFLSRFTEMVGGPLGRHSAPGLVSPGVFTVERVLILFTLAAALLGVVLKGYCRANGWDTPAQFYATCYSDIPEVFQSRGLAENAFPFLTVGNNFEYPVLTGLLAGITALLVPAFAPAGETALDGRVLAYFDVNATLIIAVWIVAVIATARMTRRRPWDAAMVALAPGIVLAGLINWDMWAVALLAVGMFFFSRERLIMAGVLIGLAVSTKLYPVLIFGAILLLAVRTARYRPLMITGASALVTWLLVNMPFAVANPSGWSYFFFQSLQDRPAGYSSPWFAWNLVAGGTGWASLEPDAINNLTLGLFAFACALIAVVALTAPRRPRLAQLAFLIVAAFILSNKVYSPQFVLWLIPLAALARPKWRDFLIWQGVEAAHWVAVWLYLAQTTSNGPTQNNLDMPYYVLAVVAHMVATAYLMARVVQEIYDPGRDPIRRHGMDDPQGGPFENAPDRFRLPL